MLLGKPYRFLSEAATQDLMDPATSDEVKDTVEELEDVLTNNVEEVKPSDMVTNGGVPVTTAESAILVEGTNGGYYVAIEAVISICEDEIEAAKARKKTARWSPSTIESILTNEKYKGDAILQKTYCTDYIKKTFVVNDGSEIPKYYAQNSHPAIVSAEVFDLTQMELEWRRSLKGSYSGKSCFASRIVCGDCGAFYGSKVWHSTDEYRRTIWRCNNKYGGDAKCSTPHVTQEELEKAFVDVMQKVIAEKDAIFAVCREVLDEVLDTSELDRIATRLQDQALGMAERVRKLVEENARVRRDQEEYQRDYDALAAEHEKLSEKLRSVEEQKKDKTDRRRRIEVFLCMLEEQTECLGFDPYTFVALVDRVVVGQGRRLEFIFRNGMKFEYIIAD